jgi:hypothetical protein
MYYTPNERDQLIELVCDLRRVVQDAVNDPDSEILGEIWNAEADDILDRSAKYQQTTGGKHD